ncbi:MAG: helix-turn-helix transcriptional regulator [Ndongobacter sp.]|nr:helix-turn-helix transcriptional regulator [Ndongobacter sp.]
MILADKIIDLRKKNGWSQEELAEKLNISRQSISKWEGAQSVPDMNKILRLSEVFGVSTDYLLKDEISAPEGTNVPVDTESDAVRVRMEEAVAFLAHRKESSVRIAAGVMLCILSPIPLIFLAVLQKGGRIGMTENQAAAAGIAVLLLFVGIAVALFVLAGLRGNRFEYLETAALDTEYGVEGMVREKKERFRPAFHQLLTIGIVLCVVAVIPIFLAAMFAEDDVRLVGAVCITLAIIAIGVFLIVKVSVIWNGMNMLLEEGDYARSRKEESRRDAPVAKIYWSVVLAGYLAFSFITGRWHQSWIVWPVAGVLYGAIVGIMSLIGHRE